MTIYKKLRVQAGYSVNDICKIVGAQTRTVERWENGEVTPPKFSGNLYIWWLQAEGGVILMDDDVTPGMKEALPKNHARYVVLKRSDDKYHFDSDFTRIYGQAQIQRRRELVKEGKRTKFNYVIIDTANMDSSK
jgi:transcriptional regulator with XRE-family HTH domain